MDLCSSLFSISVSQSSVLNFSPPFRGENKQMLILPAPLCCAQLKNITGELKAEEGLSKGSEMSQCVIT